MLFTLKVNQSSFIHNIRKILEKTDYIFKILNSTAYIFKVLITHISVEI